MIRSVGSGVPASTMTPPKERRLTEQQLFFYKAFSRDKQIKSSSTKA